MRSTFSATTLLREGGQPFLPTVRESPLDHDVAALDPAEPAQRVVERLREVDDLARRAVRMKPMAVDLARRLRRAFDRPWQHRAPEDGKERSEVHQSIDRGRVGSPRCRILRVAAAHRASPAARDRSRIRFYVSPDDGEILSLAGRPALSPFRLAKLLQMSLPSSLRPSHWPASQRRTATSSMTTRAPRDDERETLERC
jgi:hypothetical protein